MKTGDNVYKQNLIDLGFTFFTWFAGYHVYKKCEDGKHEYIFVDYIKNKVVTTLKSEK